MAEVNGNAKGIFNYQSEKVPCSLLTTGKVYVSRQETGNDTPPVGLDPVGVEKVVHNGRGQNKSLDQSGFELVDHVYDHVNYRDSNEVVRKYYPEVTSFLKKKLGAKHVYAFDHNIRCSRVESWANEGKKGEEIKAESLQGSQQTVQSSAGVVHNDYSVVSSLRRVQQLGEPPRVNDTWNIDGKSDPLIPPEEFEDVKTRRWALVNLWRNIVDTPVLDKPLALVDASTIDLDQLVTFEVRYADRTGENYFVQNREENKWFYFPEMTKDEAILLKVWDTAGKDVRNLDYETGKPLEEVPESRGEEVPASFAIHSAFENKEVPEDCPARWSIEVRTVIVY
mmetsp:Transcript_1631/g.2172  ORF Transcript_1631/g.2172 Transcript_1631/m.2172 type:complete len:338 (-) Transcript_1631:34-1047(-)|eukprot:CAMPEP_0201492496 /NCGR_PEP_ID=MMETSP0151_2-20130828/33350_1 /ASSEMBLY_ACC=CAM_ASM_000257 /TAXON_ID=200890 /ORGANISM="Paramoeba atlantica, Strain 621/1 / CCAP 1560/9" /LENGTH=337 /DNA_ID=CAMNT_0047879333 /DNA_START=51 /DNA_END=1064 /DNA_ORIENTATION=-